MQEMGIGQIMQTSPIIDMIFSSFSLPAEAPDKVGAWDGASRQFFLKMMCRDITKKAK